LGTSSGRPGERDPRPARTPDRSGFAERDGVRIWYDVHAASTGPTVVLMPTWSIVHSRVWKMQVATLARHLRVVTFDGRGCGRSDRPAGAAAYADAEFAADTLAVMDEAEVDSAVLVSFSMGGPWAFRVAADHPDRVEGLVAIASAGMGIFHPDRARYPWDARLATSEGWAKYNKYHWVEGGWDNFLRFFFSTLFCERHSTRAIEDTVRWGSQVEPATIVDTVAGALESAQQKPLAEVCGRVRCPVLVIEGSDDRIRPAAAGERLAELTRGRLVTVEGGGHAPHVRDPVFVNRLIKEFTDMIHPPTPRTRTWVRAQRRPRKALYLSSPIGLGHARRDLAIARELRRHHPDLHVDWLAQHPVTRVLADAGESVHPASSWLASESAHIEDECAEHDLHAFQAIRRMDEILVNNFMVFHDVVEEQHYDLVIGDEAWEVDHFLHENPELKRFTYAWMTDFVGWLPMPDGGPAEADLTADYNAEMIEQRARYRRLRDRSIFVGNPEDVVDESFGPGLPGIREWTEANFDFAGYVTGFDQPSEEEVAALRSRLGYGPDDRVCVVTVGGSGVGDSLLRRVLDAVPLARRRMPELRFLVVTGPRIDPASLPRRRGSKVRGYVPELYRHLGACDLAVVQGGLTTCMELTASRTPFLFVPLRHHFEQNFHVRHRLERYDAGTCLGYEEAADAEGLAEAICKEVGQDVRYRPVETDGARRAGEMLAELL
jgi:pimeloyl-ACP methyl ester carboxylesterase/predicted glycosyltransferase